MPHSPIPAQFDIEQVRSQFPIFTQTDLCYLDNAATTQKPICVINALSHFYSSQNANVHRSLYPLAEQATAAYEAARDCIQRFINAQHRHEIIWTSGTTDSINLLANSFGAGLQAGDEILISELEHHANIVPWQLLAERQGLNLRVIPITHQGDLDMEAFKQLLSDKTRLVSICHISNALGTINPVPDIIKLSHQAGAKVHIDGAQAVAHMPVDVQALDCDFYSFSGHKLFGPTGIGILYGKSALLTSMPPWKAGGEMIERVTFSGTSFAPLPLKFEAGTPPIAQAIGLAAAINYLGELDQDARHQHEQHLFKLALTALTDNPAIDWLATPTQQAPILSFTCKQVHSFDLATLLGQQNIAIRSGHHCTMPLMQRLGLDGSARLSLAFYNTETDIQRFIDALKGLTQSTPQNVSQPAQAESNLDLISEMKEIKHWQQRYARILKQGQAATGLPASAKTDANAVHGCTAKVWLCHQYEEGKMHFQMDSDARIMRGLGSLLVAALDGKSPAEVLAFDIAALMQDIGLAQHLNASRTNGFKTLFEAMQTLAQQHL